MEAAGKKTAELPAYTAPEDRGEGWTLESTENGRRYVRPVDRRCLVVKTYLKDNDPAFPVTLELRYGADGSLGWPETPSEIHYGPDGRVFKKYWYRQGVYWPSSVRQGGWIVVSLPSREGGTGVFHHLDGRVMTLTSQNNVLPKPSPFSNCELAYFIQGEDGSLIPHREGDAPAFLMYERLTVPGKNDWDSLWKPVWMEWKKNGAASREHGPYLTKMGFRNTMTLCYIPCASGHRPVHVLKTSSGRVMGRRFPEVPGRIKGIAYRESDGRAEAIYFAPAPEFPLLSIHFLPNGKKRFVRASEEESSEG